MSGGGDGAGEIAMIAKIAKIAGIGKAKEHRGEAEG